MTPLVILVAACLSMAAAWSFRRWWSSQRARARVANTLCPVGTGDSAVARSATPVPPAAVIAGAAGTAVAAGSFPARLPEAGPPVVAGLRADFDMPLTVSA